MLTCGCNYDTKCKVQDLLRVHITRFHSISKGGGNGDWSPHTFVRGGQRGLEPPHFCERGQNPSTICDNAFFFAFPYVHEIFVLFIYYPEYFILK